MLRKGLLASRHVPPVPSNAPALGLPLDLDALTEPLRAGEKPAAAWQVGLEAERFGVCQPQGRPLPYSTDEPGRVSIEELFRFLVAERGWHPVAERPDGPVVALRRGLSSITLEPGAQVELSGRPHRRLSALAEELHEHLDELVAASESFGVCWVGVGFHPWARREALPWVPKGRYPIMRRYLPSRGELALDMMQRTATVQINLDYASEADAFRKLRVALALSPLVTAAFASSPWKEGHATDHRSLRARVWLHTDPDRTGLLPFLWRDDAGYRDYVQWALDVPMFVVMREGRAHDATHLTFRRYLQEGLGPIRATMDDWRSHLNTLFPEARLKGTLEIRGADGQGEALSIAVPALWIGLLYDEASLRAAERLVSKWDPDEVEAARPRLAREALRAPFLGREAASWFLEVLSLAETGLSRLEGDEALRWLRPLRRLAERADSPADALLRTVGERPEPRVLPEAIASLGHG